MKTAEQLDAELVSSLGFDPATHTYDTDKNAVVKRPEPTSAVGAGIKSAIYHLPEAGAGLVGAGLALDATGAGALAGIPIGLLGAALGAYGAGRAKEAIIPQSFIDAQRRRDEEHPIASGAGEIVANLVGTNPLKSVKNIADVAKNAVGVGGVGGRLSARSLGILANAGAGAGIGAGISAGTDLYEGKDIDPAKAAREALIQGLSHEPNRLGVALSRGHFTQTPDSAADVVKRGARGAANTPNEPAPVTPPPLDPALMQAYNDAGLHETFGTVDEAGAAGVMKEIAEAGAMSDKARSGAMKKAQNAIDALTAKAKLTPDEAGREAIEAELAPHKRTLDILRAPEKLSGLLDAHRARGDELLTSDEATAQRAKEAADLEAQKTQDISAQEREKALSAQRLEQADAQSRAAKQAGLLDAGQVDKQKVSEALPSLESAIKGNQLAPEAKTSVATQPDSVPVTAEPGRTTIEDTLPAEAGAKGRGDRFQPAPDEQPTPATSAWNKLLGKFLGEGIGADVKGDPNLRITDPNAKRPDGTSALGDTPRGMFTPRENPDAKALITLHDNATPDTLPHEAVHGVLRDLLTSGTPRERANAREVIAKVGEEPHAQGAGEHFVKRVMGDDSLGKDVMALVRKWVGRATAEDYARLSSNYLLHGEHTARGTGGEVKNQPGFITQTEKFLRSGAPTLQKAKDGTIDPAALSAWMRQLPGAERKLLESFAPGRATPEALADTLSQSGPKAETHVYGMEGKVSEAKKEYDKMTHEWYDVHPRKSAISDIYGNVYKEAKPELAETFSADDQNKIKRYIELSNKVQAEGSMDSGRIEIGGPKATSAYSSVSALPTTEPMPEWTATKSGKNVQRVDVVVPHDPKAAYKELYPGDTDMSGYDETSAKALKDRVLWQPDNLHENLPNTLGWAMIQYKTGPKGEKIAVIAEAQSRWGQQVREGKALAQKHYADKIAAGEDPRVLVGTKYLPEEHPLLRDYNRLILKAAIAQAKKEGATHIMVSDAETAMMTEGHDAHLQDGGEEARPEQEHGMSLNYDTILPKIAEELTGSKGERVSLGEHKNAVAELRRSAPPETVPAGERYRSNLIFRNADGTPKTDVSGRLYPIDKIGARLDAGEPMTMTGVRYQAGAENNGILAKATPEKRSYDIFNSMTGRLTASEIPAVRYAGQKLEQFRAAERQQLARSEGRIADVYRAPKADRDLVYNILIKEEQTNQSAAATIRPDLKPLYDTMRKAYADMRDEDIALGRTLRSGGKLGKDPLGMYNILDQMASKVLMGDKGSEAFAQLKADFTALNAKRGYTPAEVEKGFNRYTGHSRGMNDLSDNFSFKALDMREGMKLPDSWIEPDALTAWMKFNNRHARAASWADVVAKDPKAVEVFGLHDAAGKVANPDASVASHPGVKAALKAIAGTEASAETKLINGLGRVIHAALLGGPFTRVTDALTTPIKGLAYITPSQIPAYVASFAGLRGSYERTLATGLNRRGGTTVARDILGAGVEATDRLSALASKITKLSGSEITEVGARNLAQVAGEFIGKHQQVLAAAGDKTAIDFLKGVGHAPGMSPEELGTRVAQLLQGKYDATSLPEWALKGPVAPFAAMMKWNIEQWNNFNKFAIKPAIEHGNLTPALMTILPGLVGGLGLNVFREALSGRKDYHATFDEINAAPDKVAAAKELTAKLAYAAQITGTIGVVGEIGSQLTDVLTGKMPRGVRYPMVSVIGDTLTRVAAGAKGIGDGEDPFLVIGHVANDVLKNSIQLYNLSDAIVAQTDGRAQDRNRVRDQRVFSALSGNPAPALSAVPSYSNLTAKAFEMEQDPAAMGAEARALISRAIAQSHGDPEQFRKRITAFKPQAPITVPTTQRALGSYIQFLQQTQGPEAAQAVLADHYRRQAMDRAKGSMLP